MRLLYELSDLFSSMTFSRVRAIELRRVLLMLETTEVVFVS